MSIKLDLSHLSASDLTLLAILLGAFLIIFVLLLFFQRKYLVFLHKPPQYKIDAERNEKIAAELRQKNAAARQALEHIDELPTRAKTPTPDIFAIPGEDPHQKDD